MQGIIQHADIILASKSPRRRQLLETVGLRFKVVPSGIREEAFSLCAPEIYAERLAEAKAREVAKNFPESWVIGADSTVWIEGCLLEKPDTISDARRMLERLSGKTHYVFTGYAIVCMKNNYLSSNVITTAVDFKTLSDKEVEWYIRTQEPYDKAGGYAIQGLGAFMIRQIRGSYTNVVGLPLCEVIERLSREGVIERGIKQPQPHILKEIN